MNVYQRIEEELNILRDKGNFRQLPAMRHQGKLVEVNGTMMLNLSSNDYLGLTADTDLQQAFIDGLHTSCHQAWHTGRCTPEGQLFTSSSSRLLTGTFEIYNELEAELAHLYEAEAALVLGCGYHANAGILPAVCSDRTLILADKLVHASLIDGIRLSSARCIRYRHNDLAQLERLIREHTGQYDDILIVTESIFSMDGDATDLPALVRLKQTYPNVLLYIDEAHAFGVFGARGLGCAEAAGCVKDIDFLVGTFGKATASAGAFVVCSRLMRQYLINRMRPFIFTTALPPVNMAWTLFVIRQFPQLVHRRARLQQVSQCLRQHLHQQGYAHQSVSQIVPLIVGASRDAALQAEALQRHGFYALPVRPPTVPEGAARIRFSLTANVTEEEVNRLANHIKNINTPTENLPTT